MPTKTKRDEEKWQKAKDLAEQQGQKENYAYIMGIYKKMDPDYEFKTGPEAKKATEKIPGGLAKGKKPSEFDPTQLAKGQKVESEHTKDPATALEITMDHLTEDPDYYQKLEQIEKAASKIAKRYLQATVRMGKSGDVVVYADEGCEEFAKIRLKMLRASEKGIYQAVPGVKHLPGGRSGFAGSGTSYWEYKGEKYVEQRNANGKGFYGTDMDISKVQEGKVAVRKIASLTQLESLLGLLQALDINHKVAHWQASSNYGDHLLYERLYANLAGQIDQLAEKMVAVYREEAVNPLTLLENTRVKLEHWDTIKDPLVRALNAEKELQGLLETILASFSSGSLSTGMENFLQGLADDHETAIYLLQQRLRSGAKIAARYLKGKMNLIEK